MATFQLAAFLRTTLPLDLSRLGQMDSGRYHSIWLPDHLVSLWPDSIWTPEFTDLAKASHSPHRYLDAFGLAAAAAALTRRTPIATSVVDTVRRHPAARAIAITISHSRVGVSLGLGREELRHTAKPTGR
jgi:phthiodiolone/phenolphthiodiolone dimycocerosates ketoreductase